MSQVSQHAARGAQAEPTPPLAAAGPAASGDVPAAGAAAVPPQSAHEGAAQDAQQQVQSSSKEAQQLAGSAQHPHLHQRQQDAQPKGGERGCVGNGGGSKRHVKAEGGALDRSPRKGGARAQKSAKATHEGSSPLLPEEVPPPVCKRHKA